MAERHMPDVSVEGLEDELRSLLNAHSVENTSDTPDYVLAKYMLGCLEAYRKAVRERDEWRKNHFAAWRERDEARDERDAARKALRELWEWAEFDDIEAQEWCEEHPVILKVLGDERHGG